MISEFTSFSDVHVSGDNTVDISGNRWYVVNRDVHLIHRVRCLDTANILLCDDKSMTCTNGITVESGKTLNIFVQENDSGKLIASGSYDTGTPGIGGGKKTGTGSINIHGGIIEAKGARNAAGIGGGEDDGCGTIKIYGGKIKATGGSGCPGIGCGLDPAGHRLGTIRIYDGDIKSYGGDSAAGIGGCSNFNINSARIDSGTIEICGGTIYAEGAARSSGIGGGSGGSVTMDITISGGDVTAISQEAKGDGAGIGAVNRVFYGAVIG